MGRRVIIAIRGTTQISAATHSVAYRFIQTWPKPKSCFTGYVFETDKRALLTGGKSGRVYSTSGLSVGGSGRILGQVNVSGSHHPGLAGHLNWLTRFRRSLYGNLF
jgi:hypothetical protein